MLSSSAHQNLQLPVAAVDVVKWSSLHNRSVAPTMGPVEMCYCFPRSENASSSCELLWGNTIVGQSIVSQCRVQHHTAHIATTVIEEVKVSIENRNRKRHKRNGSCTPFYYHSESYYPIRQSVFFLLLLLLLYRNPAKWENSVNRGVGLLRANGKKRDKMKHISLRETLPAFPLGPLAHLF